MLVCSNFKICINCKLFFKCKEVHKDNHLFGFFLQGVVGNIVMDKYSHRYRYINISDDDQ